MKNYRDPWAILGLSREASDKEIKIAYRKLALTCHPDRAQDPASAERFTDISNAYQVIATEEKRLLWLKDNEPFADTNNRPNFSSNEETVVTIDFSESFTGTKREVEVNVEDICSICGGSGAAPGYKPVPCDTCQGTGAHLIGSAKNVCSACSGKGFVVEFECVNCQMGVVFEKRPFVIDIPAGVVPDYKIKLNLLKGSVTNDYVLIKIKESNIFQRNLNDPADLMIEVPVSYPEAVLGSSIKIPTPTNVVSLKIPSSTPSGKVFRIKEAGMPKLASSERGNLYARINVYVPEDLSREELETIALLQRFQPKDLRYDLFDN
jgi:molecular chaperone DnaJ